MIALFGGTFNPIHEGHISLALEVKEAFNFESIEFLPSYISVHRETPEISAEIRKHLVELALQPYPDLTLNSCEIDRHGPSYAIDTVQFMTQKFPQQSIFWLMGADSFNSLLSWKNSQGILQKVNLIVCTRPDSEVDSSIYPSHYLNKNESLSDFKSGRIAFHAMQPNSCSSTDIRRQLKQQLSVSGCLSPPVLEFIHRNELYKT